MLRASRGDEKLDAMLSFPVGHGNWSLTDPQEPMSRDKVDPTNCTKTVESHPPRLRHDIMNPPNFANALTKRRFQMMITKLMAKKKDTFASGCSPHQQPASPCYSMNPRQCYPSPFKSVKTQNVPHDHALSRWGKPVWTDMTLPPTFLYCFFLEVSWSAVICLAQCMKDARFFVGPMELPETNWGVF